MTPVPAKTSASKRIKPNPGDAFTVEEAARILGISRSHAYELAAAGRLPGALRIGERRWIVSRRMFERWLNGEVVLMSA